MKQETINKIFQVLPEDSTIPVPTGFVKEVYGELLEEFVRKNLMTPALLESFTILFQNTSIEALRYIVGIIVQKELLTFF